MSTEGNPDLVVVDANSPSASQVAEMGAEAVVEAAPEGEAAGGEENPAPAEKPTTTAQEDRYSRTFAALNRKERAANAKVRAAEQRLAEIEAKIAAAAPATAAPAAPAAQEEPLEVRLRKNPFETLSKLGLSFEQLTQMALDGGKLPPELQMANMRAEIEAGLRKEIEEKYGKKISEYEAREKAEREAAAQKAQAAEIAGAKTQIKNFVTEGKDNLELLAAEGDAGIDLIYDVLDAHWNQHGVMMGHKKGEPVDVKKALAAATARIETELENELQARLSTSKAQKLVGAKPNTQQAKAKPAAPTLTNQMSQVPSTGKRFLSNDESKTEAAKLIKWTED